MKRTFLKIALLLVILIVVPETAYGQSIIPSDSCVCECDHIPYTDAQDIRCLICLQNQKDKNGIIEKQEIRIDNLVDDVSQCKGEKAEEIDKGKRKFKNGAAVGGTAGGILGVAIGWFVGRLSK